MAVLTRKKERRMLLLNRKDGERIMIGDDIVVTIVYSKEGISKVGIDAPKNIPVHREEVYLEIKKGENKSKN